MSLISVHPCSYPCSSAVRFGGSPRRRRVISRAMSYLIRLAITIFLRDFHLDLAEWRISHLTVRIVGNQILRAQFFTDLSKRRVQFIDAFRIVILSAGIFGD